MKKDLGILSILLVVSLLVVVLELVMQVRGGATLATLAWPKFLSGNNLQNTARLIGMYGVFSIGLGIVIITGGIELSVGSVFALQGVLLAMMLRDWNWPWVPAVMVAIAGTMALGWLHGLLITRGGVQPFIVTLCGLLFYRGVARFIANEETKGFGSEAFGSLRSLASGTIFQIPMPFVILIGISIIMWVVLHRSIYGRYLFAVGRNEAAARYCGINSRLIISSAYVLAGAMTGMAGVLIAFYTNSISPSGHGAFYELYGIAAAVLGGCSLRGGEGSILGIILGTALIQVLRNLVNLLGMPSSIELSVMGAVILVGVLTDQILTQRKKKKVVAPLPLAAKPA